MTKAHIPTLLATMAVAAMALTFAATGKPGTEVTARELSQDLSLVARSAGATEVSRQLMLVNFGTRANAPLNEAGAVAILQRAGVAATTSNPDRLLTRFQADVLVQKFRSSLAVASIKSGSALKPGGLPDTVDTCFDAKNHGLCVDCCKNLGGGASSCAKACMVINKPSASEPLP
jgi:hypothetical protein